MKRERLITLLHRALYASRRVPAGWDDPSTMRDWDECVNKTAENIAKEFNLGGVFVTQTRTEPAAVPIAKRRRRHGFNLGSVSHGTLRPIDLIEAFAYELRALRGSLPLDVYRTVEDDNDTVDLLTDHLQEYAPPGTYFGAHEGDGADFGFWVSEDLLHDYVRDGEAIKVPAGEPLNWDGEHKYIIEVNDHGNMTLHDRNGIIWECV